MQDGLYYTGRDIGYWRVSTSDQDPEYQIAALMKAGIPRERIFGETISGGRMNRPQLGFAMKVASRGDCIVVWKLDRLGRSLKDVLQAIEDLDKRGINVRSLTEQIDTTSPYGRLIMQILLAVAEMERNLISERTKAGVKNYQAKGGRMGKPHYIRDYPKRIAKFRELWEQDKLKDMTGVDIIKALNAADKKAPQIGVPQVFFNWKRAGYPGFDQPSEEPDDG
ncbi:MAG: recombinase family protein [Pseudomonadota bacterium]